MREIRIFELDRPGVPVSWRSARAQTIAAQAGLLWVTQEHQRQDIWLKPGQSIDVPAGVRFWLSGEPVRRHAGALCRDRRHQRPAPPAALHRFGGDGRVSADSARRRAGCSAYAVGTADRYVSLASSRKHEPELGPPTRRAAGLHATAVQVHDGFDDGQSQPGGLARLRTRLRAGLRPRGGAAVEPLEQQRQGGGRNARSWVAHGDGDPLRRCLDRHVDALAGGGVTQCVVEQVVDRPAQQRGICA